MNRRDDAKSDRVDWLDLEADSDPVVDGGYSRRVPARYLLAFMSVVALFIVGAVQHVRQWTASPESHAASPTAQLLAPSPSPSLSMLQPSVSTLPVVTELGHPLLSVPVDWELFGRGTDVVVRLQLAGGRITSTSVPLLASGGLVSFVVGADRAIIRPLDFVPGYVVADGKPAQSLTGTMQGGPVIAGPTPTTVWVPKSNGDSYSGDLMALASLDGHLLGTSLPVSPAGATPDGSGYLLFNDVGGVYDARPDGVRRITTGDLLAIGPTRWLATECDARHRCTTVVIDRTTGARRVIGGRADPSYPRGAISPDGTIAAVLKQNPGGAAPALHFLDLESGAEHAINTPMDPTTPDQGALVWSPDSRWLFVAGAEGRLSVVDRSGRVRPLDPALPGLTQLALRTGPHQAG